jgi:hypothetical protein
MVMKRLTQNKVLSCLEGLNKNTKTLNDSSQITGRDLNLCRPEYDARVITRSTASFGDRKMFTVDYYGKKTILKSTATFRNYVLTDKGYLGLFSKQEI